LIGAAHHLCSACVSFCTSFRRQKFRVFTESLPIGSSFYDKSLRENHPQVVVHLRILRRDLGRLLQARQCASGLGLGGLNQCLNIAQPVLFSLRFGIERRPEVGETGIGLLCTYHQNPNIVVCVRMIRLYFEDRPIKFFRSLNLPGLMVMHRLAQNLRHALLEFLPDGRGSSLRGCSGVQLGDRPFHKFNHRRQRTGPRAAVSLFVSRNPSTFL